ncbi:unnamed protein product [Moneuplotes crassus]|uniref:Uncharacterized protein n=1 Tax=Euplotes crassus TaxID=5936 RepID=A0AAD1UL97_EUPCR|nr:unnamed protein product [Moneuplotes crassus]
MNKSFEATGKGYATHYRSNTTLNFGLNSDVRSELSSSRISHHVVIPICRDAKPKLNNKKKELLSTERVSAYEDGSVIKVKRTKNKTVSILKNYTVDKPDLAKKNKEIGSYYSLNPQTIAFQKVLRTKKKFSRKVKMPTIYSKKKATDSRRNSTQSSFNRIKFLPQTSAIIMNIYHSKGFASNRSHGTIPKRSLSTTFPKRSAYIERKQQNRNSKALNTYGFDQQRETEAIHSLEDVKLTRSLNRDNSPTHSNPLHSVPTCPVFDKESLSSKISTMLGKDLDFRRTKLLRPFLKRSGWIPRK